MAQSVELLLDQAAEEQLRAEWSALADAGLPTEQRRSSGAGGEEHHRPHVTLFAGDRIDRAVEPRLAELVAGLDLEVVIGPLVVFGPRRDRCILVRQVLATVALLSLQRRVAACCGANQYGQFGPGRWSPHVTLARRVPADRLSAAVWLLGDRAVAARVSRCRRWDGDARTAWLL